MRTDLWTDEERSFLVNNYPIMTAKELSESLGKPLGGTRWQVSELGLRKTCRYKPSTLNFDDLTREDVTYMAGFIDGEGTITINTSKSRRQPETYVVNTDLDIVNFFAKVFGKEPYPKNRPPPTQKQTYGVMITSLREVFEFLQIVYPYLRVKKQQAKLLLEYCNIRLVKHNQPFGSRERQIIKEIRRLNHRGI